MAGHGWRTTLAAGRPLPELAFVFVLLSVPTGLGVTSPVAGVGSGTHLSSDTGRAAPVNLSIQAASTWGWADNGTELSAVWSSPDDSCTLTPGWFRWSVAPGLVSGWLSDANRSVVNFTSTTGTTGNASVTVQGSVSVSCANGTWARVASASLPLLEIAPLTLGPLSLGPAPAPAQSTTYLNGSLDGGLPPYRLSVAWGNDTSSERTLTEPGPFSLPHTFPSGKFAPVVTVTDATGANQTAEVPEWLNVGLVPTGTIRASLPVAEVGQPVQFQPIVSGLLPNSFELFSGCGANTTSVNGTAAPIVCDPTRAGDLDLRLEACSSPVLPMASDVLEEPVRPALSASLVPDLADGEVGSSFPIDLGIAGGVPPFSVEWMANGLSQPSPPLIPNDGSITLSLDPAVAGFDPIQLTVVDADGARASLTNVSVHAERPLDLTATATVTNGSAPAGLTVQLALVGGVAPVAWAATTDFPYASGAPPNGWTGTPDDVAWSADSWVEGEGSLSVEVLDAANAEFAVSMVVHLVPPLTAQLSLWPMDRASQAGLNATVAISGGVPPFTVWLNSSVGAAWNGTLLLDGAWPIQLLLPNTTPVSATLVVLDAGGTRAVSGGQVSFPLPPPPVTPVPAPDPSSGGVAPWLAGGGLVGVLGALGGVVFWRRRRRQAPTPPMPSPERVLEEILAPSDGAERLTVELLAEEAGVPLSTVRSTLTRLIAEGQVRSEITSEGEEVLAWAHLPT